MGDLLLLPSAAAEAVCHEEQLRIWASELLGALSLEGYLNAGLSYAEGVEVEQLLMREIKTIVESAFDHPEAATIRRRR